MGTHLHFHLHEITIRKKETLVAQPRRNATREMHIRISVNTVLEPYEKDQWALYLHNNMVSTHNMHMPRYCIYTFLVFLAGGRAVSSAWSRFSRFKISPCLSTSDSCEQSVMPSWEKRGDAASYPSVPEGGTKSTTSITSAEEVQL